MDNLYIPAMANENEDQNEVKYMSDLIMKFAKENPELKEYIRKIEDTDEDDDEYRLNGVFWIVREFVRWTKNIPDRHEGFNVDPSFNRNAS